MACPFRSLLGCLVAVTSIACTSGSGGLPPGADSGLDGTIGGGGTISAASYDQSCAVDADCVTVFDGDVCNPCKCPNAAISRKDLSRYSEDVATRSKTCGTRPACAADCADPYAICSGGTCTDSIKPRDAGGGG